MRVHSRDAVPVKALRRKLGHDHPPLTTRFQRGQRDFLRRSSHVTHRLSGHEHKYHDVRCAQFGLWQGARCFRTGLKHTPQWVCNRRATQPQAKFGATLRAAVLFRPDFVARSLQIHCGICSSLAPRLAKKSFAANVTVFMKWTTKHDAFTEQFRGGRNAFCRRRLHRVKVWSSQHPLQRFP